MRVLLTSTGLEAPALQAQFLSWLDKPPAQARALFIPTAAIDADAIAVLPKCMNDLLRCGIPAANIRVFDLHEGMTVTELKGYDAVYLCGGQTRYLLERVNRTSFGASLMTYIQGGGLVVGVSAGSLIFAGNLPDNLGLLNTTLSVHCAEGDAPGPLTLPRPDGIRLTNDRGITISSLPDGIRIIGA